MLRVTQLIISCEPDSRRCNLSASEAVRTCCTAEILSVHHDYMLNMFRTLPVLSKCKGMKRMLVPHASMNKCELFCTTSESQLHDDGVTIPIKETRVPSGSDTYSDSNGRSDRHGRTTYVEEEVAKFRSMADSWWDPHGDCKPLHSLNKLRVALVREGLISSQVTRPELVGGPRPLTGFKILDVGCGGGILCEPLARLGATVTGLDAAQESTSVARLHADQDPRVKENVVYVHGTIEEHIQEINCKYDAVVASEVLEHVDDTELFICTCADAIKPGGSLFLTTINKTTCAWLGAIAIAEHMLHLLPPGTHDWNKFIPQQELLFLLEKCGFVTRTVHGMGYNPLVNKWFWLSNTSVNYAVHAVKEGNSM